MSYRENSARAISQTAPKQSTESDVNRADVVPFRSGKRVSISAAPANTSVPTGGYRERSNISNASAEPALNNYFTDTQFARPSAARPPLASVSPSPSPEPAAIVSTSSLPQEFLAQHPYYYSEATAPSYPDQIRQRNPLGNPKPHPDLTIEVPASRIINRPPSKSVRIEPFYSEPIKDAYAYAGAPRESLEEASSTPQPGPAAEVLHPSTLSDKIQPESDGSVPLHELHQSLVLLWIPSALKKSRKLDAHFIPTSEGQWRVRKLLLRITNTVTPVYETDSRGRTVESFTISKLGEISIRKFDDKQTVRFAEKVHHLTTVSSFTIPEQFPVPLLSDTIADDSAARFEAELLTDSEDDDASVRQDNLSFRQQSPLATRSSGGIDEIKQHLASSERDRAHIKKLRADRRHVRFTCGDIGLRIVSESGDVYPMAMGSAAEVELWLATMQDMIRQHEHDAAFAKDGVGSPASAGYAMLQEVRKAGSSLMTFYSDQDNGSISASGQLPLSEKDRLLAKTTALEQKRPDASGHVSMILAREIRKSKAGNLNVTKSQAKIDEPPDGGLIKFLSGEGNKTSNWRLWPKVAGQPGFITAFKLGKSAINKPMDAVRQAIGAGSLHTIDAEDCNIFIEYPWASTVIALTDRTRNQTLYFECGALDSRIAWENWLRLMGSTKILSLEEMNALMDDTKSTRSGWQGQGDEEYTDQQSIQTTTLRPDSFAAIGRFQEGPNGRSIRRRGSASASYDDLYTPFDAAEGNFGEGGGLATSDMWRDEVEAAQNADEIYLQDPKHGIFNEAEVQNFRKKHFTSPWISGRPFEGGFAQAFGVNKGSPLIKENVQRHDELTGVGSAFDHLGYGNGEHDDDTVKAAGNERYSERSELSEDEDGEDYAHYNNRSESQFTTEKSATLDPASLLRVGGRSEMQEAIIINVEKEEHQLRQLLQEEFAAGEDSLQRTLREILAEKAEAVTQRHNYVKVTRALEDHQFDEDTDRKRIELTERKMWRRVVQLERGTGALGLSPVRGEVPEQELTGDEDDAELASDAMKWREHIRGSPRSRAALISPPMASESVKHLTNNARTSHFLRDTLAELGGTDENASVGSILSITPKMQGATNVLTIAAPPVPLADDPTASPYQRKMRRALRDSHAAQPPTEEARRYSDAVEGRSSLYALPTATLPASVAGQPSGGAYFAPDSTIALANVALEAKRKEEIRTIIKSHQQQLQRDLRASRTHASDQNDFIGSTYLNEDGHSPTASSLILGGEHSSVLPTAIPPEERRLHDIEQRLISDENQRLAGTDRIAKNLAELMSEADQIGVRSTVTRAAYTAGPISPLRKEQIAQLRNQMIGNSIGGPGAGPRGPAVNFDTAFGRSAQLVYSIVDGPSGIEDADELLLEAMSDRDLEQVIARRRAGGASGQPNQLLELSRAVSNTTLQCPRRFAEVPPTKDPKVEVPAAPVSILAAGQMDRVPVDYHSYIGQGAGTTAAYPRSLASADRFVPARHATPAEDEIPISDAPSVLLSASPIPTGQMGTSIMENAFNFSYGFTGFGGHEKEKLRDQAAPTGSGLFDDEDRMIPYLSGIQRMSRQGPVHTAVVAASTKSTPSATIGASAPRCAICGEDKTQVLLCKITGRKHVLIGALGLGGSVPGDALQATDLSRVSAIKAFSPVDYSTTSATTPFLDSPSRLERIARRSRLL